MILYDLLNILGLGALCFLSYKQGERINNLEVVLSFFLEKLEYGPQEDKEN